MKFQKTNLVAAQVVGLEDKLMPGFSPGDAVILDNASFRRKGVLREIASRHGAMVLFLPSRSPEYNPVEKLRRI